TSPRPSASSRTDTCKGPGDETLFLGCRHRHAAHLCRRPSLRRADLRLQREGQHGPVLDGETLKIVKTIPTARRPRGIIASPDHKEIYVACGDGDIIDVIDVAKLEVVRQLDS